MKNQRYTRPNGFNEQMWKNDVESFARWVDFYHKTSRPEAKSRAIATLKRLQTKHKHKLGDMP